MGIHGRFNRAVPGRMPKRPATDPSGRLPTIRDARSAGQPIDGLDRPFTETSAARRGATGERGRETARWAMMERRDLRVVDDVSVSGEETTR